MIKAIVTGHTQGLGAAIAQALLARGIGVLGLARGTAPGMAARQQRLDLADSAALGAWLDSGHLQEFIAEAATLLLVNNAGSLQAVGPLHEQDPMAIARTVSVNVTAPLMLAAALGAAMAGKGGLRILHVSSGAARQAYPGWSVYCATKAALDQHARAVALDGGAGGQGVRICSLAPGVIDTAMQEQIRATPSEHFPARARFVALHRDGQLSTAAQAASRIVDYLLADSFGSMPVDDLRGTPELRP